MKYLLFSVAVWGVIDQGFASHRGRSSAHVERALLCSYIVHAMLPLWYREHSENLAAIGYMRNFIAFSVEDALPNKI